MSDFLTRMVQRQRGELPTVQPRGSSVFATMGEGPSEPALEEMTSPLSPVTVSQQESEELSAAPPLSSVRRVDHEQSNMSYSLNKPVHESATTATPPVNRRMVSAPRMIQERVVGPGPSRIADISPSELPLRPEQTEGNESVIQVTLPDLPSRLMTVWHEPNRESVRAPRSLVTIGSVDRTESRELNIREPPATITIGRIEVSAVTAPPTPARKSRTRQPSMSLQEYLSRRRERGT
jgi:hypothetical protein